MVAVKATRPQLRGDQHGVSAVIAIVLVLAITVVLAALFLLVARQAAEPEPEAVESEASAQFSNGEYRVTAIGPDDIDLAAGRLLISLNGAAIDLPLTALAPQVGSDGVWQVGEDACIVGPEPCLYPGANEVGITVVVDNQVVYELAPLTSTYPIQVPLFELVPGGGIRLLDVANVRTDVVGTSLNYGAGGPVIPITAALTTDGGLSYTPLFGGAPVSAGSTLTLTGTAPGAVLGVQGHAEYQSQFSATYDSVSGNAHVWVLQDGEDAPDVAPFTGQSPLKTYLEPYIDTVTNRITLASNQVILLFEFNPALTGAAADFQDLVVLFTFV